MNMARVGQIAPRVSVKNKQEAIEMAKKLDIEHCVFLEVTDETDGYVNLVKDTLNQWLIAEDKPGRFGVSWSGDGYNISYLDNNLTDSEKEELTRN